MTYFVMRKPHMWYQLFLHAKNVAKRIDLQFVKVEVNRSFEQCFKPMYAIFDLHSLHLFCVYSIACLEAQCRGRGAEQACLNSRKSAVDNCVDRVDYVVNERLSKAK